MYIYIYIYIIAYVARLVNSADIQVVGHGFKPSLDY